MPRPGIQQKVATLQPMGLHRNEQLGQERLAIWETTETEAELRQLWPVPDADEAILATFSHAHRRTQWLASRVLLHQVHPNERLTYDDHGKPWLSVPDRHISFSHTGKFIALLSSPLPCGIDIETVSPKVERIAAKFLKPAELIHAFAGPNPDTLYIYWCAKEALYKVYGRKGVSLKDNITVQPFTTAAAGSLQAELRHANFIFETTIRYERCSSYMMAYTATAAACDTNSATC